MAQREERAPEVWERTLNADEWSRGRRRAQQLAEERGGTIHGPVSWCLVHPSDKDLPTDDHSERAWLHVAVGELAQVADRDPIAVGHESIERARTRDRDPPLRRTRPRESPEGEASVDETGLVELVRWSRDWALDEGQLDDLVSRLRSSGQLERFLDTSNDVLDHLPASPLTLRLQRLRKGPPDT